MIRLDAATVLLQWAVGGLLFLWITTRHRIVGLGYGWLLRLVFGVIAAGSVVASHWTESVPVREVSSAGVAVAAFAVFVVSVIRRKAGVSGQRADESRRKARVAAMTGAVVDAPVEESGGDEPGTKAMTMRDQFGRLSAEVEREVGEGPEFPPVLDLLAPAIGVFGLVAAGLDAGGTAWLAVARTLVGAVFLGAVSDAMLLGHWYLTQPGLSRKPIGELNDWLLRIWPLEVALLLVPTGMVSVLNGSIDDHYGGMLGWFWVACAVFTGGLAVATRITLRERFYSAVMAATGLLYLAILTAFGTDLVARAILSG